MVNKESRRFTSEEKELILKRHFLEKEAVSDLCDEYIISPSQSDPNKRICYFKTS